MLKMQLFLKASADFFCAGELEAPEFTKAAAANGYPPATEREPIIKKYRSGRLTFRNELKRICSGLDKILSLRRSVGVIRGNLVKAYVSRKAGEGVGLEENGGALFGCWKNPVIWICLKECWENKPATMAPRGVIGPPDCLSHKPLIPLMRVSDATGELEVRLPRFWLGCSPSVPSPSASLKVNLVEEPAGGAAWD